MKYPKVLTHCVASFLFVALLHCFIIFDATVFAGILTFLFIITQSIVVMISGDKHLAPALVVSTVTVAIVFIAGLSFLVYLFPIAMNLSAAFVFANTLRKNKTPLITHIAKIEKGEEKLTDEIKKYTRDLTITWVFFLVFLALISFILSFLASMETWSIFSNMISYAMIATLFLGEHIYRYFTFKEKASPLKTLKIMFTPKTWISLNQ